MGARGLVKAAWRDYDMVIDAARGPRLARRLRPAYPELADWRRRHANQCEREGRIVIGRDAARGIGRVFPLSRLPAGWSAYTRACNLPIQGACADASMRALCGHRRASLRARRRRRPGALAHDEIVLEVPETDAERAAVLLERAMVAGFAKTFPARRSTGWWRCTSAAIGPRLRARGGHP